MNYFEIEKKWRREWQKNYKPLDLNDTTTNKYYMLEMFSYPSASNLHLGHWYNYGISDSFARFKKMCGYAVFQPMGFDAFGLPAENYAIKTGEHPQVITKKSIEIMRRQLGEMGTIFDFERGVVTCDPSYYKWTQKLFLILLNRGLAYQKFSPVNFCPSCNTVIANEQVVDGACERCKSVVIKKEMKQWFLKITDYAERLLDGLNEIDWPEKTKAMQRHWIGKSEGCEIDFSVNDKKITVFTTRPDTLMGASYVVLAPEHPLVSELTSADLRQQVQEYCKSVANMDELDRIGSLQEKTGMFIGAYATHPITKQKLPIWIADYVLYAYGTGAVMGVPAHDTRDFRFAENYKLPIIRVIADELNSPLPYTEAGVMVNSGQFDGLSNEDCKMAVADTLQKMGCGSRKTTYRLRDWSVSRQRYWGAPIPVVHCEQCGAVGVTDADLPVELPFNVNFTPDGQSPLGKCPEFINTTCPKCGKPAKRDADTLDTFVCSSWYYLRYPDAFNQNEMFNSELINRMLPVDKYVGGAEHACMHLLYARFITKALFDEGLINFEEPFSSLIHQGMILGANGQKMSKSAGNAVNPDNFIKEFGSDALRMHLMFSFNYTEGGAWNEDGIKATVKFMERVERIVERARQASGGSAYGNNERQLEYALNYAIKAVRKDFDAFSFNTVLARIMELVNALYKYDTVNQNAELFKSVVSSLIRILAPCAPHFCEELNSAMGNSQSVFDMPYPEVDESKLKMLEVEMLVQINSRPKHKLMVSPDLNEEQLKALILSDPKTKSALEGKEIKKIIVIKGKLLNIVV